MAGLSPTQRTLRALRDRGLVCGIVEKRNYNAGPYGVTQDLFGIIDIIALDPQRGVIGVQSCGVDFSGHMNKMTLEKAQECIDWLKTPGTVLELWGWRKIKKVLANGKKGKQDVYMPRIHVFTLADFGAEEDEIYR